MSDKTSLGDRMKRYEDATRQVLPPRSYTVVRVDVRAAHTLLRNSDKPFDADFIMGMNEVSKTLCKEIQGSVFAYTQSDEVSVLYTDFQSLKSQPWFGGVVVKQATIAASVATEALNSYIGYGAHFDARVFTLPDAVEVANYFVWRQKDAVRNSISMLARAHMSHREMQGLNSGQLILELGKRGVNWSELTEGTKRGRVTRKFPIDSGWVTGPAPEFAGKSGTWLAEIIPVKPAFEEPATHVELPGMAPVWLTR